MIELRKLRVVDTVEWRHHRGGWRTAMARLRATVHSRYGTAFIGCVEDHLLQHGPVDAPWVGVLHQVPRGSSKWFPDLNRFMQTPQWRQSAASCLGVWVLSEYSRFMLRALPLAIPIDVLIHPACTPKRKFNFDRFISNENKLILSIGHHQRRYKPFFELRVRGYRKVVLISVSSLYEGIRKLRGRAKSTLRARVSCTEYDDLLAQNIVFLNLSEAAAVNTIVECIARATPVLVNRHPAIIGYLGEEYPFYYRDLREASRKLGSQETILETARYLRGLPIRTCLRVDAFVQSLMSSPIYASLPIPSRCPSPKIARQAPRAGLRRDRASAAMDG